MDDKNKNYLLKQFLNFKKNENNKMKMVENEREKRRSPTNHPMEKIY